IDTLVAAQPSIGDEDQGLVILHGRFNLAKIRAKAKAEAKNNEEVLKIHKVPDGSGGTFVLYEVNVPTADKSQPLFVALANDKTIIASPGKDYVIDALKTKPGSKPVLKNKQFQSLLEKVDGGQSLYFVAISKALNKGPLAQIDAVKGVLAQFEAVAGGLT